MEKHPADAAALLQRYDKANQDLLFCLMPLVARLGEGGLDHASPQEVTLVMEQLSSATVPLRPRAALVLDRMCYCQRIDKFGVFEPLPDDHPFQPGDLVLIYAEVRNFSSQRRGPIYETQLGSAVKIKDACGQCRKGWEWDFRGCDHPDRSLTLRNDYFSSYRFCLPLDMPPGNYTLWLTVEDRLTQRPAVLRALPLHVLARGNS